MATEKHSVTAAGLPKNDKLVGFLRQISFGGNLLAVILLAVIFWVGVKIPGGAALLFLIIAATTLFHATESSGNKTKRVFMIIPVTAGFFVCLFSVYLYFFSFERLSLYSLLSFIFIGTGIAIPYIKNLTHRFHPAQFLAFLTLIPNLMATFGMFNVDIPIFYISLLFVLISLALLLRWPGRGFMGIFTTDSVSSSLAFKFLVSIMLLVPLLGFIALDWNNVSRASISEVIAVLTVSITALLIVLIWINTRQVYKTELENFLMKEELKVHNIDLKLSNEDLVNKMQELENSKKRYAQRLNYQDRFRDIAEGLG
jgi:hypothetical protein